MPLPNIRLSKVCSAKSKRTGMPCKNPVAFGCKTCRMHGARKSRGGISGHKHWNYQHGKTTKKVKARTAALSSRLRYLVDIGNYAGAFIEKPKFLGRPPSDYTELDLSKPELLALAIVKSA